MKGMIKNVLLTLAVVVIALVAFIFVIGTTGRDGAAAGIADNVISSVNANIAEVTGISHLIPYINPARGTGSHSGSGVGADDYDEVQSGGSGGASGGTWN